MSQGFKAIVDDSDEEEKNDEDNGVIKKTEKQKKGSLQFGGCSYRTAKKVVVSPFNKVHKLYKKHKKSSSCSSNSHQIPILSSNNTSTRSGNSFSCLCVSKPQNLETDFEAIDPNESGVSYEYIKSLIEKNDFYSKECNTHIGD
ncbi:Ubiquitin-like-specific protease 1A [Bienertia sinuspersici]